MTFCRILYDFRSRSFKDENDPKNVDNIPFNIEEAPKSAKGIESSNCDSRSSENGKRTIIDLDEYNEEDEEAKGGKKMVQVKIEPNE
nr:hypothetical protein [Tanacetum cinerariifolium]